ncbi:MAG: creatininase family protein [Vicinamibacterales bacterium]|jgi:creatinine amidohydrolase/Fe(II)-dependent formamide hydrolase-like protein|nr:creatininase family protein [Vicinamibacterales bacterium]HJN43017.1 creatininase family protein [Vicinamibacterales bacterium]
MKTGVATALLLAALPVAAQERRAPDPRSMGGGDCRDNVYNCADTPNPLPEPDTVWLEEMTWMDVRDALAEGQTTAIVPTGGMEPNGPWLVTGKHNYVLRANCDAIARRLGDAICTPIIKLVPEGTIEPPSGHMRSPGTISLREETFRAMLTDVAHSLKAHGFRNIVFIGDSGGNQGGQRAVAEALNTEWNGGPVVAHVQEYYDYASAARYMAYRGLVEGDGDGLHDDPIITLNMFATDPRSVRYEERLAAGLATINGVSLADRVETLERAREVVTFRADHTVDAIRKAIANRGTLPAQPRPARGGGGGGGQARQRPAPDPRTMGGGDCRANAYNCSDTPNPLPAADTVWLEEMTWMDVRDAMAAGKTTVIIPTGGIEPNGPWLVTGKHNYVLRANCDAIARDLGNAVCAPVMELVPEGQTEPPSGHMRSPGTLSLRQETFEAVLTDVAHSLKVHGFKHIVFIGDSGGNRSGMDNVATALSAMWTGEATASHISEYYRAPPGTPNVLRDLGVTREGTPADGLHDNPTITLNMMLDDPRSVRWAERVATRQADIDGVSVADLGRSLELARAVSDARAKRTADVIRTRIADQAR